MSKSTEVAVPVWIEQPSKEAASAGPRARSLRANFAWTFSGHVIYAGCQWGILVALARLGNPVMIGEFALALALTTPVFLFAGLQARGLQATDARREFAFGDYLGLRLLTTSLAVLGIGVIGAIALARGYEPGTATVILLLAVAKAADSITDICYGLLQQHERMDWIAVSLMIRGALSLVVLALLVYVGRSLVWGVAGLVLTWTAVLMLFDLPRSAAVLREASRLDKGHPVSLRPSWPFGPVLRLALQALPLGLVTLLLALNTSIPRFIVERDLGFQELGIFAALAYLMVAGDTVMNALCQATVPRLACCLLVTDLRAFRALLGRLLLLGALLAVAGLAVVLIAGRPLLRIIYGDIYAERVDVLTWLTVAAGLGFVSAPLGSALTAARQLRSQALLFPFVTVTLAVACTWLVPEFGLRGAALALVAAAAFQLIGLAGILLTASLRGGLQP